jgi:hypothetical protein
MDQDNDPAKAEQRDVPGGEMAQRSLVTALASEAHHVGDTLLDAAALYGAKQGVDKVVDKIRKPSAPPPPPPSSSASEGEA